MTSHPEIKAPPRIASLDQFRGYTVVGMLLVNFAGGYGAVPAVFKHHNTYCSYADTIMPQFFFAVGFALRLVLLRNREKWGAKPAYRRALRRIGLLAALGLAFYNVEPAEWLRNGFGPWMERWKAGIPLWRDSFQTLVHIAVTSLWVLPVIAASGRVRIAFSAASVVLHLGLSEWFWYRWLNEHRVIDGGPPGFLTWTVPVIVGSLAHDWWTLRGPRAAMAPIFRWALVLMLVGYALSCVGAAAPLAAPPFFPPHGAVDLWTMSQRAGSASYQVFAAGFSLAIFGGFVWLADVRAKALSLFSAFGQNALAAYLLAAVLERPFSLFRRREASLMEALALTAVFIAVNAAAVVWMNRRRWFLRL